MKRFELIDGDAKLLSILINEGWELINTFPNPYPQPYFFALVLLTHDWPERFDLQNAKDFAFGNTTYLIPWNL